MSDYDRYANSRSGAGIARSGVAVDQGLRAYMIGVYNYMTLGLGVTGLVAYGAFTLGTVQTDDGRLALTDFGHAIYASPLRWLIVLSPLALVFWHLGPHQLDVGVDRPQRLHRLRGADRPVDVGAARGLHGRFDRARLLRHGGGLREPEPLRLHDPAQPFGDGIVHDDGPHRPHHREPASTSSCKAQACSGGCRSSAWRIFAGLTAWDTQSIKEMYYGGDSYEMAHKKSIHGALRLYLDFINMFQAILMLTGSSRNN